MFFKKKIDKKSQASPVYLYCVENDKIYNNLKDLTKELKVDYKTIKKSIHQHQPYKGHTFIVL